MKTSCWHNIQQEEIDLTYEEGKGGRGTGRIISNSPAAYGRIVNVHKIIFFKMTDK